jgi:glycosyltransferase involved in cell wall biosynthesis
MSAHPAISVVVPAYNEQRWIGVCLDSLISQTHRSYELIVVDDGSRDATAAIARREGIRLLRTSHRGAGAARDAGLRAARAPIVVFCDADEIYSPDFLSALVGPLETGRAKATFPGTIRWHNPREGLAPGWLRVRGEDPHARGPSIGSTHPCPRAVLADELLNRGGYPVSGYGEDHALGEAVGDAVVIEEAELEYTLPTHAREVLDKARWFGRGPRFARGERPGPVWLMPFLSLVRAVRLLRAAEYEAAVVRLVYDIGLVVGFVESRLSPSAGRRAP